MRSRSRRSCQTKNQIRSAAARKSPIMRPELQPNAAPNEIAETSATTAGKKIPSPAQSKRTRFMRSRLRGTSRTAARAPNSPKGTLTKKMRRHPPAARSSPPIVGPRASPKACAAPCRPMARPSDRLGTISTMMARLFACSIAAPTACKARKPQSAARSGAKPQSADASVKSRKP